MSTEHHHADAFLAALLQDRDADTLRARLHPDLTTPVVPRLPRSPRLSSAMIERRLKALANGPELRAHLLDPHTEAHLEAYAGNIEYGLGTVKMPVGVAGPLRVRGLFAGGDYPLPLATTEAALVASYHRGALAINDAGGCTSIIIDEAVSRAPGFAFPSVRDSGEFVAWVLGQLEAMKTVTGQTTRHGELKGMKVTIEGNHVYLILQFHTGDASGQNMVTLAAEAICQFILENSPVTPDYHFVEANLSGDKKASAQSFTSVRGRKVTTEVKLSREIVEQRLQTTPERMTDYWRFSAMGGVLSGTMGVHGHYANGLAALYIATGQDAACVAESAVGTTRLELTPDGGLYATLTLPNLMLGTVGGGTGLPSQQACLNMMGLAGTGKVRALAEVAGGLILAGELSIIAALSAGHFARAHRKLGRERGQEDTDTSAGQGGQA